MGLDIRFPISWMFGIVGALLLVYGVVGDPSFHQRSLGINLNLWWGAALLLFGGAMRWIASRSGKAS